MAATSATPPPIPLVTPDPGADEARRRGLRRMRTVAVGLLLLAACVYVATLGRDGFWGFVNAGAEASMVGAIADWFAVTALFKHPLGLPIPHTALIPKRNAEALARGLPWAELELLPDTGHALFAEDRDLVRRLVARVEVSIARGRPHGPSTSMSGMQKVS